MSIVSFKERYNQKTDELRTELSVDNVNALPRLTKVTVNVGTGRMRGNKEMLKYVEEAMRQITGQKPVITIAKKSIAGFKLREGEEIGMKVTLRGQKMHDFLDRIFNIALPRLREFRGIDQKNFDKQGNLTIGFVDSTPFAELGHAALDKPFGISMTLTFKNSSKDKGYKLLRTLGLPVVIE